MPGKVPFRSDATDAEDAIRQACLYITDPVLHNAKETQSLGVNLMTSVENMTIRGGGKTGKGSFALLNFHDAKCIIQSLPNDRLEVHATPILQVFSSAKAKPRVQRGKPKKILEVPVPGRLGLIKSPTGATVRMQKIARTKEAVFFVTHKAGKKVVSFKSPIVTKNSVYRKGVSQTRLFLKGSAGYLVQIKVYKDEIEAAAGWFMQALGFSEDAVVRDTYITLQRYQAYLQVPGYGCALEAEYEIRQAFGYNTGHMEPATEEQVQQIHGHLFATAPKETKRVLLIKMVCYGMLVLRESLSQEESHVGTFHKIVVMTAQNQIEEMALRALQDASKRHGIILNKSCVSSNKSFIIPNFNAKASIGNMAQASSAQNEKAVVLESLQTITTKPGMHASVDSRQLKKESFEFLYKETPEGKACGKIYVKPTTMYRPPVLHSHVYNLCKACLETLPGGATWNHAFIGNDVIPYRGPALAALQALERLKETSPVAMAFVSLCLDEVGDVSVELTPYEMLTPVLRTGREEDIQRIITRATVQAAQELVGKGIVRYVSSTEIQRNPFIAKHYTEPFPSRSIHAPLSRVTLQFIQDQQVPEFQQDQKMAPMGRLSLVETSVFLVAFTHDLNNTEDSIVIRKSQATKKLTHLVSHCCSVKLEDKNKKKGKRPRNDTSVAKASEVLVRVGQKVRKGQPLVSNGSIDSLCPVTGTCSDALVKENSVSFRFSQIREPEDGDKVFLPHGQKFTIRLRGDEDMPWLADGRIIDAIVAPRSILSRETPQLLQGATRHFLYNNYGVTETKVSVNYIPVHRSKHDSRGNRSAAGVEVGVNNRGGVQKGRNALGDGGQSWGYMERHIPYMQGASHILQGILTQSDGGVVAVCKHCHKIAETKLGSGYVCVSQTCSDQMSSKKPAFWLIESSSNFVNMVSVFNLMGVDTKLFCKPKQHDM